MAESRTHLLIQRLSACPRLFRSVQHHDPFGALGERRHKRFCLKRTEQTHLHQTIFRFPRIQMIQRFFDHFAGRSHGCHDYGRIPGTVIVKQAIVPAGFLCKPVHICLHDLWQRLIKSVAGLPLLEKDIRILSGAAQYRMIRI